MNDNQIIFYHVINILSQCFCTKDYSVLYIINYHYVMIKNKIYLFSFQDDKLAVFFFFSEPQIQNSKTQRWMKKEQNKINVGYSMCRAHNWEHHIKNICSLTSNLNSCQQTSLIDY